MLSYLDLFLAYLGVGLVVSGLLVPALNEVVFPELEKRHPELPQSWFKTCKVIVFFLIALLWPLHLPGLFHRS